MGGNKGNSLHAQVFLLYVYKKNNVSEDFGTNTFVLDFNQYFMDWSSPIWSNWIEWLSYDLEK